MKFKGNCGKLMLLWAQPLTSAVATCLHAYQDRMLVDKLAVVSMVAKYEKDFLAQVDIASEKLFEKSLISVVHRGLSGNVLTAITAYINNKTPDQGFERIMELFLEAQQAQGHSLEDLLQREDFQTRLLFLQKKEREHLEVFMKENRIKFNPDDKLDLASLQMDSFLIDNSKKSDTSTTSPSGKLLLHRNSVKHADSTGVDYDKKFQTIQSYLMTYFESKDGEDEGSFEVEEFWGYLSQLPIEDLGFGSGGFESMRGFTEWETDGRVFYNEVLFELSDSVLAAIEAKTEGESDVMAVVRKLQGLDKVARINSGMYYVLYVIVLCILY
jgi:hypothetical protein